MNGQYFGSKNIVVQYAFKKDGKGERHGDQAERMLASQAKKHNVQLPVQPQIFEQQPAIAAAAAAMMSGDPRGNMASPMNAGAPGFAPPMPPGFQTSSPHPPGQGRGMPPSQNAPLAPPPSGLPARPPPSMSGYAPPNGYAPPPGFAPPGFGGAGGPPSYPPGFGPPGGPPGPPPMMPPGFQAPYGNR
jgi:splicing factor 3B subunit 4